MHDKTEMDDQLKALFDYTKFHIGIYITLTSTLVAILALAADEYGDQGNVEALLLNLQLTVVFFALAGACGGFVASNIPNHHTFKVYMNERIGFWRLKLLKAKMWIHLEHTFFWIGVGFALLGFFGLKLVPPLTAPLC